MILLDMAPRKRSAPTRKDKANLLEKEVETGEKDLGLSAEVNYVKEELNNTNKHKV